MTYLVRAVRGLAAGWRRRSYSVNWFRSDGWRRGWGERSGRREMGCEGVWVGRSGRGEGGVGERKGARERGAKQSRVGTESVNVDSHRDCSLSIYQVASKLRRIF